MQIGWSREFSPIKNGKTSRRAHLTVLVHRVSARMLGRDLKLYTTVKPPAFDPSVAPPKIFAKYALSRKERSYPREVGPSATLAQPMGHFCCVMDVIQASARRFVPDEPAPKEARTAKRSTESLLSALPL